MKVLNSCISLILLSVIILFIGACGRSEQSSGSTGSLAFGLDWKEPSAPSSENLISAIPGDCSGVETVRVAVYDDGGTLLRSEDFPCSDHQGSVDNVPVGLRTVVIHGLDGNGEILYWAEEPNVTIWAGETTDLGTVDVDYAVPVVNTIAEKNRVEISWDSVTGAASYNIYWSKSIGVNKINDTRIKEVTSPYTHTGLTNATAYYYAVTAVSAGGESALSSEVSATPGFTNEMLEKLLAPDAEASDFFGLSVAISGDYAIVGAHYEDTGGVNAGAAYIYQRTGANTWDTGTKIMADDAEASDYFGYSVAISGDYAIVGAHREDERGVGAGAAYIFWRIGNNLWDNGTKIMADDAEASDYFGYSVAISGDYAIVGAHREDERGVGAGAAYIFWRIGNNLWDNGTKIMASDAEESDYFGVSVAISGDYAIVGAPRESERGSYAGAAYIFWRIGNNLWDNGTKIMADDAAASDRFGFSVAISGDYAIVGAYGEDEGGAGAGAAYIFQRTDTNTWDAGTKIMADDAEASDRFGRSVAISGDYAIVGAYGEDTGGADAGAAYIFQRTDTNTWDAGTKIMADDAEAYDFFGLSVAISGDYAIVGAYGEDTGGADAGAAYLY